MRARLATSIALLAVAAPAASAAPSPPGGYREGGLDSASGINCTSIVTGNPIVETQVTMGAAAQTGRPAAGEVFYGRLLVGIVGTTCNGANVVLEVIPPRGVEVRADAEHPFFFDYVVNRSPDPQDGRTGVLRSGGGSFGGLAFDAFFGGQRQPIPLSNDSGPVELHVPLMAARRLNGTDARRPSCRAQGSGAPPCSREQARDHLQVAVQIGASVTPTLLVADVGLVGGRPARPKLALRSGRLTVRTAPRARVRATFVRGGRRVARVGGRAASSGEATLRVPQRARGSRVTVVATTIDGAASPPARAVAR
jgi:hypothetical protein